MEFNIACEKGTVSIVGNKVSVSETGGKPTEKDFPDQGSGVKQEVAAWAESLIAGKPNPRQSPDEALADLEILEKMLRSGEGHGKTESLQFIP
jgi:predicted dehydrogenase